MSRAVVAGTALLVLAGGIAAVVLAAARAGEVGRAVVPSEPRLALAYPRAAAAAYGRRVLVLRAPPLAAVAGEILESARAGGGWELHPVAPAGADGFATALAREAAAAASDWDASNGALHPRTVDSLARAGVAIIVVDDGRQVAVSQRAAEVPGLAPEPSVPALRVRGAEPVMRVVGDEVTTAGATRPRLEAARVRDFQDQLWGGRVTVEVAEPGTFVFAWPREGALVTVNGVETEALDPPTEIPFVTLELAVGDADVAVGYAAAQGRAGAAIGGALAIVVALITLLLAFRPHPDRDEDSAA